MDYNAEIDGSAGNMKIYLKDAPTEAYYWRVRIIELGNVLLKTDYLALDEPAVLQLQELPQEYQKIPILSIEFCSPDKVIIANRVFRGITMYNRGVYECSYADNMLKLIEIEEKNYLWVPVTLGSLGLLFIATAAILTRRR